MKLNREDIKKMVVNQILQEGVLDTLKKKILSSPKEQPLSAKKSSNKKLETVADFLQMAQRSKELSDLILKTKVGQAIFGQQTTPSKLEEILSQDFAKMMRSKGLTDKNLDDFVSEMSKNATAQKMLAGLGLAKTAVEPTQSIPAVEPAQQASKSPEPTAPKTQNLTDTEIQKIGNIVKYDSLVNTALKQNAQDYLDKNKRDTENQIINLGRRPLKTKESEQEKRNLEKQLDDVSKFNSDFIKYLNQVLPKDIKDLPFLKETITKSLNLILKENNFILKNDKKQILIQQIYNVLTGKNK